MQQQGQPRGHFPKIITRQSGIRQVNSCCLNLSNIKVGPNRTSPTDVDVSDFSAKTCKLNVMDISKICNMRNRQEAWVSFKNEALANDFEKKLLQGISWGNNMIVTGHRMMSPLFTSR